MSVAEEIVASDAASPSSYARKALAASAVGYAMDGFDLLILGFMLRAISADLHLDPPQAGSLITWTLIGAVVGGILFGMLGRLLRPRPGADLDDPAVRGVHRRCAPSRRATGTCWSTAPSPGSASAASSASAWRWSPKPGRPQQRARACSYVGARLAGRRAAPRRW